MFHLGAFPIMPSTDSIDLGTRGHNRIGSHVSAQSSSRVTVACRVAPLCQPYN